MQRSAYAVCTLFEKHYHYGVAALTNSLYTQGYRGSIYVGYKGAMPPWALQAKEDDSLLWNGSRTYEVSEGLQIHFLPVDTDYHLTNYKPDFMLELFTGPAKDAKGIAYFDPDIVIKCSWTFLEQWMNHGVAVVHEMVNNPMPFSHPIRLSWGEVIEKCNKQITRNLNNYFNGGFCGVSRKNIEFVNTWCDVIHIAAKYFDFKPNQFVNSFDRAYHFQANDQDALNIAAMCCESPISEIGPDGMDLSPGGWIMSHAIGSPKPWKKNYVLSAIAGIRPTKADRSFWTNVQEPIRVYTSIFLRIKKISISIAGLIGRFYGRR